MFWYTKAQIANSLLANNYLLHPSNIRKKKLREGEVDQKQSDSEEEEFFVRTLKITEMENNWLMYISTCIQRVVVIKKKKEAIRICIDSKDLNDTIKRER